MAEYDIFGNLKVLTEELLHLKEMQWQSDDDSACTNLFEEEEELATKHKQKLSKKPNTRKKVAKKTESPKTPQVKVERPVLAVNRKTPPKRRSNRLNKISNKSTLQATEGKIVQPTTRKTAPRKSTAAISAPARGRGKKRNQRASVRNKEPVSAPSDAMLAIQKGLKKCADASAAGVGRSIVRSRSKFIAEMTARGLLSFHVVPDIINLDSDDEAEVPQVVQNLTTTNVAAEYDDDNPELEVKVMWDFNIERYKLRKYQKFVHLIQKISEAQNCSADQIVCNLEDLIIRNDDTPASIDLKSYHIVYARVVSDEMSNTTLVEGNKNQHNANQISLKIQSSKWNEPLQVDMMKTDKFAVLYVKCAEQLQLPRSSIQLKFDGDELPAYETPETLDFEDGEAVDLRIID